MPRKTKPSDEGIAASANTYRKCARLLANALGLEPASEGRSGRKVFDLTLERIKDHIHAQEGASAAVEEDPDDDSRGTLDQDDFSPNQLLGFMERTALRLTRPRAHIIERAAFLAEVNKSLVEEGGLEAVIFRSGASKGRAGWIRGQMSKFLRRHGNLVEVVEGQNNHIRILARGRR